MNRKIKLSYLLWLFALVFVLLWSITPVEPGAAQSGGSSCLTCHETEGKNPISDKGDWHVQHAMSDMCVTCHGGDAANSEQARAHIGILTNPLTDAEARCGLCHPDDWEDRANIYLPLLPTEPPASSTPTLAPTEAPTTQAPGETDEPGATEQPGTPAPTVQATGAPATEAPATPTPAAAVTAPTAPAAPGGWFAVMRFTRGPLFKVALAVFAIGMLWRLFQALRRGWKAPQEGDKHSTPGGVAASFARGLGVFPYLPGIKGIFKRSAVTYVAGGLFHLGLLTVIFLTKTHMSAWKSVIGFGWPVLPATIVPWLSAIGIIAMLALLINRVIDPVLRLLSGPADWLNWLFVFLPMITGFVMARGWGPPYEMMYSIHMFTVCFLLVWIPLSRISHFIFYFFSRTIHGAAPVMR